MAEEEPMEVKPILDIPCADPGMDFKEYAASIASLLRNARPPRLTVGIFGQYGSGKTTLMRATESQLKLGKPGEKTENGHVEENQVDCDLIEKLLAGVQTGQLQNKQQEQETPNLTTVWFDAWQHEHEEHLFLPFLSAILRRTARQQPKIAGYVCAAMKAFIRATTVKFSKIEFSGENVIEEFQNSLKDDGLLPVVANYTDVHYELSRIPWGRDGHVDNAIAVFIDDLDRCLPKKAFGLLEALKSFMDKDGFMFVLGLDPRSIETYLRIKYTDDFCVTAEEYLQKIFQVPVWLPQPTYPQITEVLNEVLADNRLPWGNQIREILSRKTANDVAYAYYLPRNIRQAKRLLNMHQIIMATEKSRQLDPVALFGLLTVQGRWPAAYDAMHHFADSFDELLAARETDGSIPPHIPSTPTLTELKDPEFAEVYKIVRKALGYDTSQITHYLNMMKWPNEKIPKPAVERESVKEKSDD